MAKGKTDKKEIQVVGVGGLIVNRKGEVLLTKRIELNLPEWNGRWGIPGGNVEFGEHPRKTLFREIKEELGVEVKLLHNTPFVASYRLDLQEVAYHGIFLCFPCLITNGKPRKISVEHSDLGWFNLKDIDFGNCIPLTKDFIDQLLESGFADNLPQGR